jgi:hypothetical protein
MPRITFSSDSLALRVMAISSVSQPNVAGGQAAAHAFHLRLQHLPHVIDGRLIRVIEIPFHRFLHDAR